MRRSLVLLRVAASFTFFLAFQVQAEAQASSAKEALNWLQKIQISAQRLNYSGTFVYQQGNQVRTSRITHVMRAGNEFEKLEILDGMSREYIRNNEEIISYMPENRRVLIEKRVTRDVFPAIVAASPAYLARYYHITQREVGRVAGYASQSLELRPKDNLRYGYKLWAERESGLLLRAQTINDRNEVVEQITFTHITIGGIDAARVKTSYPDIRGWQVERAVMQPVALTDWTIAGLPPGFQKIRELKRVRSEDGNPAHSSKTALAQTRDVIQIVFSDGLAAVSVFIEPGSQSRTEGSLQQGAMHVIGKRHGDFWLTIVGEVPAAAIRQIANSIEFQADNIHP